MRLEVLMENKISEKFVLKNEGSLVMNIPRLAIVIPCYNEEEVLDETIKRLSEVLDNLIQKKKIANTSYILFVDDGSQDATWELIEGYSRASQFVKGLKLSRNQGHQNALIAGMEYVADKCDCLISIDADLQDDVGAVVEMIDKLYQGSEIVYGVRSARNSDTTSKRITAELFYKLMKYLGVDIVFNHADYRLLSSRAIKCLLSFDERNLFIRGMIPLIGLKADVVYYERNERFAGESKYPFKKMLSFAVDGITSFSVAPLRLITLIGFLVFVGSLVMGALVLYTVLFTDKAVHGWASTVLPIYFIGGIQLLALGVIGEYIGKIYKETKRRPRYFIEKECF
jgi:glycosyltransferase involved in cell wall biosynthesis